MRSNLAEFPGLLCIKLCWTLADPEVVRLVLKIRESRITAPEAAKQLA